MADWLWDALRAHFEPLVRPWWDALGFWRGVALGLIVLIVGGAGFVFKQRTRIMGFLRRDEQRAHDRRIFAEADGLLSEADLREFLGTLSGDHSCRRTDVHRIDDFTRYFDQIGHHYLDGDVGRDTASFVRKLKALDAFVGQYFTVFPRQQKGESTRYCMTPNLNVDRGAPDAAGIARYEQLRAEIDALIAASYTAYQTYRHTVKQRLHV